MPIRAFVFDAYGTLFDTQSIAAAVEGSFPGQGDLITQIWRQKQLEYSWLRTAMDLHADFGTVTREALAYALGTVASDWRDETLERLCAAYDRLELFPDARETLASLRQFRLAILSNGSPAMLSALLGHCGIEDYFEAVVSTDPTGRYKPHPDVYGAIASALALAPYDILMVSSNGFDLAGARRFGLKTLRIERMPANRLRQALSGPVIAPGTMFAALRSQADTFAGEPDFVCASLNEMVGLAPSIATPKQGQ